MSSFVYGVATNDAGYQVRRWATVNGKQKCVFECPYYTVWKGMIRRCYSAAYLKRRPTYSGCTVCKEWLTFSNFKAWMFCQDWLNNQLDKDILVEGNKEYGPDKCVFVPAIVNTFITDSKANRGDLPIGVTRHKKTGRFQAQCCNPFTGKQEYLGLFDCPSEAHKAWMMNKSRLAVKFASILPDKRVADAMISRFSGANE